MTILRIGMVVIMASIFSSLPGCTANEPFHTKLLVSSTEPPDPAAVIEAHDDYKLGFVEFDDQGWFYNPQQLDLVEKMIRDEAGLPAESKPTSTPASQSTTHPAPHSIVLVVFVHGWKDTADSNCSTVAAFRESLDKLSDTEQARALTDPRHPARRVVGVYVGWRGMSVTWDPAMELTFWSRKDTAHRVGSYGGLTRLLVELENIQNDSLASLAVGDLRSDYFIIGHSFGGAAVYSAVSQILTERFTQALHDKAILKPLGDQIILLNPAFEAQRHFDLNQLATEIRSYPHQDQRPVFSIFTTKADWATHYAFPIGRFLGTIGTSTRGHEQWAANLDAVGWHKPFLTHELDYRPGTTTKPLDGVAVDLNPAKGDLRARQLAIQRTQTLRNQWDPNRDHPISYEFDNCLLKPLDGFKPGDPFLVVAMAPQIMGGHTDINNPILRHFLWQYIQFCQRDSLITEKDQRHARAR